MSANLEKRERHREVPGDLLFGGRHDGPVDPQRQHLGRAAARRDQRAGHGPARNIQERDAVAVGLGQDRAKTLPVRADELVDVGVDDPVRLVAIARHGGQLVGDRVLGHVALGEREPDHAPGTLRSFSSTSLVPSVDPPSSARMRSIPRSRCQSRKSPTMSTWS